LYLGEPNWMEDYRRWNTDSAYFAGNLLFFFFSYCLILNIDDEDTNDYQPSAAPKSEEHVRFAKDKEEFKQKYKTQIDQVLYSIVNIYFYSKIFLLF
jgi:hypothetical protein